LEETVAQIWRETLELDRVGVHDNFFDLGGHSLLAARIIARIRAALGVDLSFEVLFNAPTVAGLAAALAGEQRAAAEAGELEQLVAELEAMPDDGVEQALRGEGTPG
jgi:acyl carrier protein